MNITRLLLTAAVSLGLLCSASCSESGGDEAGSSTAAFRENDYIWEATNAKIETSGGSKVSFSVEIVGGGGWCSFSSNSQVLSVSDKRAGDAVFVYMQQNSGSQDREAKFDVRFSDGVQCMLTLRQRAYSSSAKYDAKEWAELPHYRENSDYIYKTYYTTLTSSAATVRNYSICFDTKRHVSQWVAYPMHRCYTTPSLSRVDSWGYDPNDQMPVIPESVQQFITEGAYGTGHNRGHMLPNASRYNNYATNSQTFYATNMMPQHGGFNGGSWAELEGIVRNNSSSAARDTLYVVTGTYFGDNYTIKDRKGLTIAVPSHAYKVLLKARNRIPEGKSIADLGADELKAIGFWFPNPQPNQKATVTVQQAVCSVAEIEAKTGFDYFRILKPEVAKAVKEQKKPGDWGIN